MTKVPPSIRILVLTLLGLIVLPGCLAANRISVIIYDADRDMFRHLRLYLDIASDGTVDEYLNPSPTMKQKAVAKDYDLLVNIYTRRRSFIPTSLLFTDVKTRAGWIFDGESGVLVLNNHNYDVVSLARPPLRTSSTKQTILSLDDIAILPGRFFRSVRGTLCYYHQTEVSAKLVDQLLAELSVAFCDELRGLIAKEQERRRSGGSVKTLKMMREEYERQLRDGKKSLSAGSPTLLHLDDTSLQLLLAKAKSHEIGFRRAKSVLEVQFELSASDASYIRFYFALAQKEAARDQASTMSTNIIRGVSVESVPLRSMPGTARVTVRLDVSRQHGNSDDVKLLRAEVFKNAKGTDHAGMVAAVSEVLKRGVVVSQTARSINQLIDSFRQGTLK